MLEYSMSYINVDLRETHIVGTETREQVVSPTNCPALALYRIRLAGISYALPPFRFVRHQPAMSQLLVCLAGSGQVWMDEQWQECSAGMAYVTPTGAFHAYYASSDEPWHIYWLMYDEHEESISATVAGRPALLRVEPAELGRALEGLYHEYMGPGEEAVMLQWTQLIHVYAQRMMGEKHSDPRLLELFKTVDANLAYPWQSEELAARAGMSCEHLRRLCLQHFGLSPMKQVTKMRMQRAMALLSSDSETIESIALRVGYQNPFAFSNAFKRHTHMPPSAYRAHTRPL